jgi:hypothetical protein
MLFRTRISSLKHSALVFMITATVFLAGTALPDFAAMAEEAQPSAAPAENTSSESTSADAPALLTMDQLVELVGPIALYPDELLAITLPAATFPLDIVQAARYLEKHKKDSNLKPDEKWDSSILGLLNYPEVIDLMNKDLDWTWKLGAAVADQQGDVMDAIQQFRNQAHTAGNLDSNEQQIIIVEKEVIKIESATPEVIYVPTYQPSKVVVVQSAPYPYYYSAPYPYYYNPHAAFWTGMFVGAAISYGVGWGRYGGRGGDVNVSRGGNTVNIGSGNAGGGNRPGAGNRPGGGNRPGAGGGNRPGGGNKPGAGGGNRPGGGNKPGAGGGGNRPSTGQKPGAGGGGGNRPSAGTRPSTGQKPSTGSRPSSSNRGSFSGQGKSGGSASKNSQRGSSSRSSKSGSRSSSSRGGGGRSSSSRGGGGRSGGGGRGGGGGGRRR